MTKIPFDRPEFRNWVDQMIESDLPLMPLTHITKGIVARDIIREGFITPTECPVFNEKLAYFFYGRPAYRVSGDGAVKIEAACPYCFIFDEALISRAKTIYAFDTGAFENRLYKHALTDEMDVEDFSLEKDFERPNRIIGTVFKSVSNYFEGDTTKISAPEDISDTGDFLARGYLQLLKSTGRNEPDDRICSIEVQIDQKVDLIGKPDLVGKLKAIVVPHTLWNDEKRSSWLEDLDKSDIIIAPYIFVPGRHPEYYHAQMESAVRNLYMKWGIL